MKKMGMLLVCLLTACGGSKSSRSTAPPPAPVSHAESGTMAEPESPTFAAGTRTPDRAGAHHDAADPASMHGAASPELDRDPAAETAEPMAAPMGSGVGMTATAELKSVKDGSSMGTLTFEEGADGQITISGHFTGLKKNAQHAMYVHEKGDCSNKARKVGGHLNPTKAKHGPPASSQRHAGDFGNLEADETGMAHFSMTTDSITMAEEDRPDSVLNRAVVIYSGKDNARGTPGSPLACGVIEPASR
jgi:superoxide dismutase, Cu-Zn family